MIYRVNALRELQLSDRGKVKYTMGTMYIATCPCGYKSGELLEGCGMAGVDSCHDLARCDNCHTIFSIRSSSVRHRCPRCSRKVQIISIDEEMINNAHSSPLTFHCPQCGNFTMKLHEVGLWD